MGGLLRVLTVSVIVARALMVAPPEASAQPSETASRAHAVEVTPFVSMGSEMSPRIGAAVAFAWTETLSGEIEVGYREGALSSSFNVLYSLPALKRVEPYLAAGVGLEQRESALVAPGGTLIPQKRLAVVVNAGGGVKVPVTDRVGYRADARWSNAIGTQPEAWRIYHGMTLGVSGK